jgi:hypothetical protein
VRHTLHARCHDECRRPHPAQPTQSALSKLPSAAAAAVPSPAPTKLGVFVVLGVLVAGVIGFVGYRVAKSAHQNADGSVSFSTPNGTITTGKSANISAADLGTEPYPGATNSVGSMNMKTSSGSMVTAVYTSPDPADKIVAFYKEKLGDEASVVQTGHGTTLTAGERDKNQITISLSPQGDLTKIAIIHITSTK